MQFEFKGWAGPMGGYLSISACDADWCIRIESIQRDSSSRNQLAHFHDKPITREVIQQFIPGWRCLDWRQKEQNALSPLPSASYAKEENGLYSIEVSGNAVSSLTHEQVIQKFRDFMEDLP